MLLLTIKMAVLEVALRRTLSSVASTVMLLAVFPGKDRKSKVNSPTLLEFVHFWLTLTVLTSCRVGIANSDCTKCSVKSEMLTLTVSMFCGIKCSYFDYHNYITYSGCPIFQKIKSVTLTNFCFFSFLAMLEKIPPEVYIDKE